MADDIGGKDRSLGLKKETNRLHGFMSSFLLLFYLDDCNPHPDFLEALEIIFWQIMNLFNLLIKLLI